MPRGYKPDGTKLGFQKGYKISENTKIKMRKPKSEDTKKKMSQNHSHFWRGKKQPEEANKKRRQALMGNKNSLGYKQSKEHIEKSRKIRIKNGYWKNPEITKKKMSLSSMGKHTGEKSSFWQGGIWKDPYPENWTKTLKRSIRIRDKYTCQICRKEPSIIIHHIDYNKQNCNPDNLITLCFNCHSKTNFKRKYWIKFFSIIMKKEKRSGVRFILENGELR